MLCQGTSNEKPQHIFRNKKTIMWIPILSGAIQVQGRTSQSEVFGSEGHIHVVIEEIKKFS